MLLPLILTVATFTTAQTILPTAPDAAFPACALSCTVLLNAQTLCIPPDAPVTDQFVYDQCFCQSSFLSSLYSSPDQVCTTECPVESDRQLLQGWYTNFCAQVAQTILPTTAGATSTSSLSTDTSTTIPLTSSTTSSTDAGVVTVTATEQTYSSVTVVNPPTTLITSPSQSVIVVTVTSTNSAPLVTQSTQPTGAAAPAQSTSDGPWIDNHWKWVLMLGLLILGLGLLAWLAVFLKRRHTRRKEEREAASSGFPQMQQKKGGSRASTATLEDMFGPHQHQQMSNGFQYTYDQKKALGTVGALSRMREKSRERRRERSAKGRDRHALTAAVKAVEMDGSKGGPSERPRNRKDTKGKGRDGAKVSELDGSRGGRAGRASSLPPRKPGARESGKLNRRPGSSREIRDKDIERDPDAIEKG